MKTETKWEIAHFVVEGRFLTNFCRDLVLEGKWEEALRILIEDLHGMTYDIALDILRGNKTLTRDSSVGIELEDEVSDVKAKYLGRLDWLYGGLYRQCVGEIFRPYAAVTLLGPDDAYASSRLVGSPGSKYSTQFSDWWVGRVKYYMRDPHSDIMIECNFTSREDESRSFSMNRPILFERIRSFPIFLKQPTNNPQEALDFRQERGWIDETGYEPDNSAIKERDSSLGLGKVAAIAVADMDIDTKESDEAKERKEAQRHQEYMDGLITSIHEQADKLGGYFDLKVKGSVGTLKVPYAPFEAWALEKTPLSNTIKWEPVCPMGLKLQLDSPYHSDWWFGAGLTMDDYRGWDKEHQERREAINSAAYGKMFKLQDELCNFKVAVLSGSEDVTGTIRIIRDLKETYDIEEDTIIVIPFAAPEYLELAHRAKAVITEEGGKMAHLVNVLREKDMVVVRDQGAMKKYRNGNRVIIKPGDGIIDFIV